VIFGNIDVYIPGNHLHTCIAQHTIMSNCFVNSDARLSEFCFHVWRNSITKYQPFWSNSTTNEQNYFSISLWWIKII